MKICHTNQLYYPAVGGAELLARWVSERMASYGHKVHIFTANANNPDLFYRTFWNFKPLPTHETIGGVEVHRFPLTPLNFLFSPHLDTFRGIYWLQRNLFNAPYVDFYRHGPVLNHFLSSIKKLKPDIIAAYNNYPWTTFAAFKASQDYGIPLIVYPLSHTAYAWAHNGILKDVYEQSSAIIVSTEFERNFLTSFGISQDKIELVPHGIDTEQFKPHKDNAIRLKYNIPDNVPVISFIGRKITGKGVDVLIDAMAFVWKSVPNAYVILAGKCFADFQKVIDQKINQYAPDQRSRIIDIPTFSDEEKLQLYAATDIFVLASNIDSFSMALLEARACQIPVIACRNTPQESFIRHNDNGYLVIYGDPVNLAEGITDLLENPQKSKTIAQTAYNEIIQHHSLDQYCRRLLDIYQKCLNN